MTPAVGAILAVRAAIREARGRGETVGFVPTMGALHAGHAGLVRVAAGRGGFTVVSVFVNPTQFGPNEDFARYPRALDDDRRVVAAAGGHLVFAPTAEVMYPPGAVTSVEVAELDRELCGPLRPGHFSGVATVVLKLLNIVQPDFAVFGAKDAQQARIIRRMVRDLDVPVEIIVAPTAREADGLALSSRNRYLAAEERAAAPGIFRALDHCRARLLAGERDVAGLEAGLRAELARIPGAEVEYARIVDDDTLRPLSEARSRVLVACAVRLGRTRLIDNVEVQPPPG